MFNFNKLIDLKVSSRLNTRTNAHTQSQMKNKDTLLRTPKVTQSGNDSEAHKKLLEKMNTDLGLDERQKDTLKKGVAQLLGILQRKMDDSSNKKSRVESAAKKEAEKGTKTDQEEVDEKPKA